MLFLAKYLWARPMVAFLGGRIKVSGKENIVKGQHYLIMVNHASYSDIPTLFRALPFYLNFVAKTELSKIPFLGWYMRMSGMIFIDRSNKFKSKKSIDKASELIKKGKTVVIFPEGTTSVDGTIAPFKRGAMRLAMGSESQILPVRIKGTGDVWPGDNNLKIRGGKIDVIIGKPIHFDEYKDSDLTSFLSDLRKEIVDLG